MISQDTGMIVLKRGESKMSNAEKGKEWIDRMLAAAGILLALPLGIGTAMVCALSGEGIFYAQERIGKDGIPFLLYKFRTMRKDTPILPREKLTFPQQYYIPGGAFLRSTGLDELPQLWCVLRGEMSLVGPRPLLACEQGIHRMRSRAGVYALRPGITGLAQLCGDPPPSVKAKLDAIYLRERSFWLDSAIILSTVMLVMRGRGQTDGKLFCEKISPKVTHLLKKGLAFLVEILYDIQ